MRVDVDAGELEAEARELAGARRRVDAVLEPTALAAALEPLAAVVARSWVGPHAAVLAAATRVETSPLAIVTAGTAAVRSGGATVNDLTWGTEAGGGRRVGDVRPSRRNRAHRRRTTRQFHGATNASQRAIEQGEPRLAEDVLERVDVAATGGRP